MKFKYEHLEPAPIGLNFDRWEINCRSWLTKQQVNLVAYSFWKLIFVSVRPCRFPTKNKPTLIIVIVTCLKAITEAEDSGSDSSPYLSGSWFSIFIE